VSWARLVAAAALLVAIVFARAFGLLPFQDDWGFALEAAEAVRAGRTWDFAWGPVAWHWHPLSSGFQALNVAVVGVESDVLVRSLNGGVLFATLLLFAVMARRLACSAMATAVGLCFLAFAQVNAHPLYAFDAYTQHWSDSLAWAAVCCVLLAAIASSARWPLALSCAPVAFVLAMLAKETAAAAIPATAAAALWFIWVERVDPARRRGVALVAIAVALLGLVLLAARIRIAGWLSEVDPYNSLCLTCLPGHLGLLIAGNLAPLNTLDAYVGFRHRGVIDPSFLATAFATSVVIAALVWGLIQRHGVAPRARLGLLVVLLMTSALGTGILSRVFERHAHALVFWMALLVAAACDGCRAARQRWVGRAALLVLIAGIGGQLLALHSKLDEIRASGERAQAWASQVERALGALPADAAVVVLEWPSVRGPLDYDQIRITSAPLLLWKGTAIAARGYRGRLFAGRDDPALHDWLAHRGSAGVYGLLVTDDGVKVQPWKP
jgi:hypothetical protein